MQQILTYFFLVVYSVTILGIILVIITENRNPLKTLPWIVVLVPVSYTHLTLPTILLV